MRVNKKVVIDMKTNQVIERDSYEYSGPVFQLCGGGGGGDGGTAGVGGSIPGGIGLGIGTGGMSSGASAPGSAPGSSGAGPGSAPGSSAGTPGGTPPGQAGIIGSTVDPDIPNANISDIGQQIVTAIALSNPITAAVFGMSQLGEALGAEPGDDTVGDQEGPGEPIAQAKAPIAAPKLEEPAVKAPISNIEDAELDPDEVEEAERIARLRARNREGRMAMRKTPRYLPNPFINVEQLSNLY